MLTAAVYVPNRRAIYVVGGMGDVTERTALVWAFNIDTKQWTGLPASAWGFGRTHSRLHNEALSIVGAARVPRLPGHGQAMRLPVSWRTR